LQILSVASSVIKTEILVSPSATWQCWAEPPHWTTVFSVWESYPEGWACAWVCSPVQCKSKSQHMSTVCMWWEGGKGTSDEVEQWNAVGSLA